ncbi:hypothetical protein AEAC466_09225 [Asticcacaulis sp. AC466]|uniref:M23 family metallopeptidase n=1 Tax=Asticcacaulis sp. AC466 TaxID=1282362 RepID=UPI0003C3F2C7|nr:M23 family metallopeptidase [Asticcacaulis sp. AC466]ESQ84523.1 hypothetical protein AEAC466_09225 [Asticcacaulis sp. AC466]
MIPHDHYPDRRTRRPAVQFAMMGLGGVMVLALQACTATPIKPKYPIYMQDRPAPVAAVPVQSAQKPIDEVPTMTTPSPSGSVQVADLDPPPPPPPPAETVSPRPVASKPTATAPVRETRVSYVYVMQAKDTLFGVSRRFGVPIKELYTLNDLTADSPIRIGQKVLLPAKAADKGSEEHASGPAMTKVMTTVAVAPTHHEVASKPSTPTPGGTKPAVAKPGVEAPAIASQAPTHSTKPSVPPPGSASATTPPIRTVETPASAPAAKPVVTKPTPTSGFPANAQIAQMGKGKFVWPVRGRILVPFGQLAPNVRNDGINIASSAGTEIKAASDGVVVYEGDQVKELGNTIYIKHEDGWYTGYSHLQGMKVRNNERVSKGQVIGTVGQTGTIDQPQLHFEIRYTPSTDIAKPIDPTLVLP